MGTLPTTLELIGKTPIVRLPNIGRDVSANLFAKLEFLNPGGSNKDRIGLAMLEAAERDGKIQPGGTIVEPTSGNTGIGLAIAAAHKGYRCVFVLPDKMSHEKIATLRAYGAEVVVTPTAVPHDSPHNYYEVAKRLAREIPNAYMPDQYENGANPLVHYKTSGPEIWEQMEGAIDAIVISVGTGGSISGIGKFIKERSPNTLIVGADPDGSIFTSDTEHPMHSYLVEGIGKDNWPRTLDAKIVDRWIRVDDAQSFAMARRLAREEGLLVGGSAGTTAFAALQIARELGPSARILMTLPDGGRMYLSKFLNDQWMAEKGLLAPPKSRALVVSELLERRKTRGRTLTLHSVTPADTIATAVELMRAQDISQMPVLRNKGSNALHDVVGSVTEKGLLDYIVSHPNGLNDVVARCMQLPMEGVATTDTLDVAMRALATPVSAVLVCDRGELRAVVTRSDILEVLAERRFDP